MLFHWQISILRSWNVQTGDYSLHIPCGFRKDNIYDTCDAGILAEGDDAALWRHSCVYGEHKLVGLQSAWYVTSIHCLFFVSGHVRYFVGHVDRVYTIKRAWPMIFHVINNTSDVSDHVIFLNDPPWIKSTSNELGIIFTWHIKIVWLLWRHLQSIVTSSAERKPSEWSTGSTCEIHVLYRHLWNRNMLTRNPNG